jgi:GNAT superfamily N-acetyltransferase
VHSGDSTLIFEKLTSSDVPALHEILGEFAAGPNASHFSPHSFELDALRKIAANRTADLYFVAAIQNPPGDRTLCGYGILRGWEAGFNVPSLGLFVSPEHRGRGVGRKFMQFLHTVAKRKGAERIRLTVHAENESAVSLYRSFGYNFEPMAGASHRLVGIASLVDDEADCRQD